MYRSRFNKAHTIHPQKVVLSPISIKCPVCLRNPHKDEKAQKILFLRTGGVLSSKDEAIACAYRAAGYEVEVRKLSPSNRF